MAKAKKPAVKKTAPKKPGKPVAKREGEQPSIKDWLAEQFKKGSLPIADALAYAASTGRSKVTVYRMAATLGAKAKKGVFEVG